MILTGLLFFRRKKIEMWGSSFSLMKGTRFTVIYKMEHLVNNLYYHQPMLVLKCWPFLVLCIII